MIALWIVLAVVVVALVSVAVTVGVRRRHGPETPAPPTSASSGATMAPPKPAPPPAPPRAPPGEVPSEAPPEEAPPAPLEVLEAPPEEATAPAVEEVVAPPRFRDRLGKTRGLFTGVLGSLRSGGKVDAETWDELEEALLRADVGVATTTAMLDDLKERVGRRALREPDDVVKALRADLLAAVTTVVPSNGSDGVEDLEGAAGDGHLDRSLHFDEGTDRTNVWLLVGVNGVGKTTTIGKLARREQRDGRSVLLAAGDTFRAAAAEQLAQWAERAGADIVRGTEGGDPSAVVFDAVQRAAARGNDLVLADTAGRLHTKVNLVEELKKIRRVADRPPGTVSEVLLVLDATTGQNALAQARQFTEAVGVTGVVLTKLDGTAKGGVVVAIQRELGVPVKLVGLGEGPDDLVAFDPDDFVEALLG